MRLTWKQFETLIKSKNKEQLQEIILDVAKDNKDLQKEIYFRFESIETFTVDDYKEIEEEIREIAGMAYRSLTRYHRVNKKTLSSCLTSLQDIFRKKVKPLAKQGYYEYTFYLVANMLSICEDFLENNPTKRLDNFEIDLKNCLLQMFKTISIEDLTMLYFCLDAWVDTSKNVRNMKEVQDLVLSDEEYLIKLEEQTQKWLDENYIDDLSTNLDNKEYNIYAAFNAFLKDKLGIPNMDMMQKFINCLGVRNYFINKLYENEAYQSIIDYSKKIKALKGLSDKDLHSLNLALMDSYKFLGDKQGLKDELEYNISTYDQENLEMLAEYLSFYDREEQKEQAEWFLGSKPFANHDYNLKELDHLAKKLIKRQLGLREEIALNLYIDTLKYLLPKEIVDSVIQKVKNELKKRKLPRDDYDHLTHMLNLVKPIDEKRVSEFAKELQQNYKGRAYLQQCLIQKGLV